MKFSCFVRMEEQVKIGLCVLLLICSILLNASEVQFITITNPDSALLGRLGKGRYQYVVLSGSGDVQLFADEALLNELRDSRYRYQIRGTREQLNRELEEFHNYAEVTAQLQQYATDYSEITRLESLGTVPGAHLL